MDPTAAEEGLTWGRGPCPILTAGLSPPERPCRACRVPCSFVREIAYQGVTVFWAYVCDECRAREDAEMVDLRRVREDLRAAGVSDRTAGLVMQRWFIRRPAR